MADYDEIVKGLRAWTRSHDPHVRAAVEYLIADGFWLGREDFVEAAVRRDGDKAWIDWDAARLPPGESLGASSSQAATLRLAVAIGSDLYRLSRMDDRQAGLAVTALAAATGMERMLRG
jgi:hypothetical protein